MVVTKWLKYAMWCQLAVMTGLVAAPSQAQPVVHVNGYHLDPSAAAPKLPKSLRASNEAPMKKWIVQFHGPVGASDAATLREAGCRISSYLPDFAFVVTMDAATRKKVEAMPSVRGILRYQPAYKIDKKLNDERGEIRGGKEAARVHVRVDGAEYLSVLLSAVHQRKGKVLNVGKDVATVEISRSDIARLAGLEETLWIEEAQTLRTQNEQLTWVLQTNAPADTTLWNKGLLGQGQIIGLGDTGIDYDMPWFRDPAGTAIGAEHRKIIGYDAAYGDGQDADIPGHGTHVAATVCGDQSPVDGGTAARGMAPQSRLYVQDLTPGGDVLVYPPADLGDLFGRAYTAGARVHSDSWGSDDGSYTIHALTADRFLWDHKDFLALFPAGNLGPQSGTIGSPGSAKNIVTVGATLNGTAAEHVASFSSNGPAADGRIKPTVMAPGDGVVEGAGVLSADSDGNLASNNAGLSLMRGTSMATAAVAGASALVRQYFTEGYYPSGAPSAADAVVPSAALIKAVLVNSAQNMTGGNTGGTIPSSGQGWGRVNLSNSLAFQGDGRLLSVVDHATGLDAGSSWSADYTVVGTQPLKITLVWTDYPSAEGAAKTLVNDLDLQVTSPDGQTFYAGNVFSGGGSIAGGAADHLNVEEQVLLLTPLPGTYTVRVSGYNAPFGPQPFALVVTGASTVSSKGSLLLNKAKYSGSSVISMTVTDRDLNADGLTVDSTIVMITSTTEPGGEQVALTETGPNTSVFTGTIQLQQGAPAAGNGYLEVTDNDLVAALYQDSDTGAGMPGTATDTARIDTVAPAITAVAAHTVTDGDATITWSTNESADTQIHYGTSAQLGATRSDPYLTLDHSLSLPDLQEQVTYYYAVHATDEAGNTAVDDNNGAGYTVTTVSVAPSLTVYSSEGSETYLDSTVIFGVSQDRSGVAGVTVNGNPAAYRSSDGYYELSMDLSLGGNVITVVTRDTVGNEASLTTTVTRLQKPDLVVSSVSAPVESIAGSTITIADTVANNGPGNAKRFTVTHYLSTDAAITTTDRPLASRTVDALAAGASSSASTSADLPATLAPGIYYIGAIADPDDAQLESDETNNSSSGVPITITGPDLQVAAVGASVSSVVTGATFTVASIVVNTSEKASAGAVIVDYYLSRDQSISSSDVYLATHEAAGKLEAGNFVIDSLVVTVPKGTPGGVYYIGAIVDPYLEVIETNENNNTAAGETISVTGPDLAALFVAGPEAVKTGETVTTAFAVVAASTGGAAPASTVGVYLSTDEIISTSDLLLGTGSVGELEPGGLAGGSLSVPIPLGLSEGTYYIGAIADSYDEVSESDEQNNAIAGNAVAVHAPDLRVRSISGPASAVAGSAVMIRSEVDADSSGGAAGGFTVSLYLAADPAQPSTYLHVGDRFVAGLASGASSIADTTVTIPSTIAVASYTLIGVVDSTEAVVESNENNNSLAGSLLSIAKPDLLMTSFAGDASAPTGGSVTVSDAVSAAPDGSAAGPFTVGYYLSTDGNISTSDIRIGGRTVNGLAPGAVSASSSTITIPTGIAGGNYYLGAIADSDGQVVESREDNNLSDASLIAIVGPDLTLSAVASAGTVKTGGTLAVSVTANGAVDGGAAGPFTICVYLSQDAKIIDSDIFLGSITVPGLLAGSSHTGVGSFAVPAELAPRDYTLGGVVDCHAEVPESRETNNDLAGGIVTVVGPDLSVTALTGPSAAVTGETIAFSDTVANAADSGVAPGTVLWYYLSTDNVITAADVYLGYRFVDGLAAGSSSIAESLLTIPADLAAGTYFIGAIVDPQNTIAEGDETNNARAGAAITVAKAYPDLKAIALSAPVSADTEQRIVVSAAVKNEGPAPSGGFWASLYFSPDSVITSSDVWLGDVYIDGLLPGAAQSISESIAVPASLATGTYTIGIIVDRWNQILEGDEANNAFVGNTVHVMKVYADLVAAPPAGPSAAYTEDQIAISGTLSNQGQGSAEAFAAGLYLSADGTITTGDIYLGDVYVNRLAAGASESFSTVVTVPPTVATGNYYIGIVSDRFGGISESNEANNAAAGNQIAVTRRYPDLVIASVSGPSAAAPRTAITVTATVRNNGINSAEGFYVGLYLSADQTINSLDIYLGEVYVSGLGAGAEQPVMQTVTLPNVRGTFYIGAYADRLNMTAESNKNNNGLAGNAITVSR